jgi:hypothetical protein
MAFSHDDNLDGGVLKDSFKIIKIHSCCSQILHSVICCYNFPQVSNHVNIILMEYFFQGESKKLLFLAFERGDFCVLQWDAEAGALVTL